nr:MAG TPA: hypothetical protein [Caudoviricetes sp.]
MANDYNYTDGNLSNGGGRFEEIVRRNAIDNTSGLYSPKAPDGPYPNNQLTPVPPTDSAYHPEEHRTPNQSNPNFDKGKSYIYYTILPGDYSREFVNYNGLYGIEFLVGYEDKANEWKESRLNAGKTFRELKNEINSTIYVLNEKDSEEEITRLKIDKTQLVKRYDTAEELTPVFKDLKRQLDPELTRDLSFKTAEEVKRDIRAAEDLKLFSDDILNRPAYFFGETTFDDVGFYRDKGNRIRAGYDPSKTYRSQRLVEDLLKYGKPEEYAVAKYPEGTLIFVISVPLSQKLVDLFGGETNLAGRWNDLSLLPKAYDPTIFEGFEHAIDPINQGRLVPANDLFGNTTVDPSKK